MNGPYFVNSIEDVVKLNELLTVKQWEQQLATEFGLKVLSFNWVLRKIALLKIDIKRKIL